MYLMEINKGHGRGVGYQASLSLQQIAGSRSIHRVQPRFILIPYGYGFVSSGSPRIESITQRGIR